ncbi:MAG: PAS domain-containing protein [Deltaproteobacteria bacterium]|nr:PAS domain-containing protein [Deltaproteobacteria bacterium]
MKKEHELDTREELLEANRVLVSVLDGIKDKIMVVDTDYKIMGVNESLARRVGKSKHEILGRHCYRLLHNLDKPCAHNHPCSVRDALRTGEISDVLRRRLSGPDVAYTRSIAYPILDDRGEIIRVIQMERDITKWKKVGDRLYNMQKLVSMGKLAAGLAHELNNPMAVILGFVDLLLEKTERGTKSYDILKTIERQGFNCKRIVENLTSFATSSNITKHSADVNKNLERVLSMVMDILRKEKIVIEKNFAGDLPRAKGNPEYLRQVFMNLITNAVTAMHGGGRLTVSTRHNSPENKVEILFRDTGHGIKREHRNEIFDPFFTTREVGDGAGLGLSACYGLVSKYDGDITFETVTEEDDRENKGTTFTVSLLVDS